MSGLSDLLQDVSNYAGEAEHGVADWAKSVPGAAKQVGEDVGRAVGGTAKRARKRGASQAEWLGMPRSWGDYLAISPLNWLEGAAEQGARKGKKDPPALPANEADISGQKYKFSAVDDPTGAVTGYTAQGDVGSIPVTRQDLPFLTEGKGKKRRAINFPVVDNKAVDGGHLGEIGDPAKLSDKEYDLLTHEASKGNKLAQEILVKGHYKGTPAPTLKQDLAKLEDPFVKALGNLPNVANTAEAQVAAVTAPYDFTNAETQVNNILTNQGFAANAKPSAATSAYVSKMDAIAGGNPLTSSALGLPTIDQALGRLGPLAKQAEGTVAQSALLNALLSHIQYQDVYGTGLSGTNVKGDPSWLQQLLASVTGTTFGAGLPAPAVAAAGGSIPGVTPGSSSSTVPNTG